MASVIFNSPKEMQEWGRHFARGLKSGDTVALVGELGSGKTTLVQGIAKAWGYKRGANSPTFALANEYETPRGTIYHMDMYRLSQKELGTFPLEDYWGRGLCLIEWADRVRDRWLEGTVEIQIKIVSKYTRRVVIPHDLWRGIHHPWIPDRGTRG